MSTAEERLSRFVAMLLRHKPHLLGLEIAEDGWVSLPDLVSALQRGWSKGRVDRSIIRRIVDLDPKNRYEIDRKSRPERIRACYGHSVAVRIDYPESQPPGVLYHGTARRFLSRIFSGGLRPMGRLHVHLSQDIETARIVGARRDTRPVVLLVDAEAMVRDGCRFYRTPGGIYLAEAVEPRYLRLHCE